MKVSRINLPGLLLVLLAIPVWGLIFFEASRSTGFGSGNTRYYMPPIVLCGLTVAIHRLVRSWNNAWPVSMLFAGVVVMVVLSVLKWAAD